MVTWLAPWLSPGSLGIETRLRPCGVCLATCRSLRLSCYWIVFVCQKKLKLLINLNLSIDQERSRFCVREIYRLWCEMLKPTPEKKEKSKRPCKEACAEGDKCPNTKWNLFCTDMGEKDTLLWRSHCFKSGIKSQVTLWKCTRTTTLTFFLVNIHFSY